VRKRNNRKANIRISRGNLAFKKNVAMIQAAGGEGFVKRLQKRQVKYAAEVTNPERPAK
jgi:hypothetical protein